jgi:hypothetical protein
MNRAQRLQYKKTLELRSSVGVLLFAGLSLISLTHFAGQSADLTIGNGSGSIYAQAQSLEATGLAPNISSPATVVSANAGASTVTPTATPTPAENRLDLIRHARHADILWRVYGLESSWGKNDQCTRSGQVNGFGFRVNKFETHCYDTFAGAVADVDQWFDDQLQTMTLPESLCLYNEGIQESRCDYVRRYNEL